MEQEIESQLEKMKQEGKYIALSLHPAFGVFMILWLLSMIQEHKLIKI